MNRENKYWRNRANLRMDEYHKDSDSTVLFINSVYDKAMQDIQKDIDTIFFNFCKGAELTPKEAKELLNSKVSKKDLESIRNTIGQIQDKSIKAYMMAQLNVSAYKARITRLEAIKESININIKKVADIETRQATRLYTNEMKKAYYYNAYDTQREIGLGFSFADMDENKIQEILKNDWSGKHYSERVWNNTEVLKEQLTEIITSGLMNGTNSRKMATEIEDLSKLGKFASERLIRTETTYVCNMSEIQSYKACEIKKYIFVATLDLITSKQCRKHDKKVYEVSNAVPGENLPPLHPHCRSSTIAYRDKETLDNLKRRARDPKTGKTYVLDKNMSYDEWYQKFVVEKFGKKEADVLEKYIKNKTSDKNEYEKYKNLLGKEAPKTFDKFKELKYNNTNEWQLFKDYSKSRSSNMISAFNSFEDYKKYKSLIESDIVGLTTSNGIKITGQSKHFIERVLGTDKDFKTGKPRDGVEISDIKDAIINGNIRTRKSDPDSVKFVSDNCIVSINPNTGNLIQVNPQ